jgi:hypothetical protein
MIGTILLSGAKVVVTSAVQDHDMTARGEMVMGFDQIKTSHHFHLYTDGGSIEVTVNDANDSANRDAIRAHLPHIAEMFGAGNFDAPMEVHAQHVPGTAKLAALKSRVSYKYVVLPNGGRVDIVTKDAAAVTAVHDFLKFQISDHKTGDSIVITKRP